MEIPPTHYPASRAASVVENCINYQQGTPHKVFLVQTVQQASMEVSPAAGHRLSIPEGPQQPPARVLGLTVAVVRSGAGVTFRRRGNHADVSSDSPGLLVVKGRQRHDSFLWALAQGNGKNVSNGRQHFPPSPE